tara:strand:+ start:17658 stop:17879 length:222 start_codon:yes stop_codon:yes gene_type:complete
MPEQLEDEALAEKKATAAEKARKTRAANKLTKESAEEFTADAVQENQRSMERVTKYNRTTPKPQTGKGHTIVI